jgi:hypothetical protein
MFTVQSKDNDLRRCSISLKTIFSVFVISAMLSACTSTTNSYRNALAYVLFPEPDHQLSRAEMAKRPYGTLYAKVGDLPQAVLTLAFYEQQQEKWLSGDRALLILAKGRLIKTTGFSHDLRFATNQGQDPLSKPLGQIKVGDQFSRLLDWSSPQHTSEQQQLLITATASVQLELLQHQFDAVLVTEQVTFADQSTAINQFWFDRRSGRLLQSVQQTAAFAPRIKLTHITNAYQLLPAEVSSAS